MVRVAYLLQVAERSDQHQLMHRIILPVPKTQHLFPRANAASQHRFELICLNDWRRFFRFIE